jgi:hypothetical protein
MTFVYKLPILYSRADASSRRAVREQYVKEQNGLCMFCNASLDGLPPSEIKNKQINLALFPPGFLKHPIHLQHNHSSDLTEGAVHAYCNAVMWQYHGK